MTWVLYLIIACGALSIAYGVATTRAVLASDPGTPRMQEIAAAIQEGAKAYLARQYTTIAGVGLVIFFSSPICSGSRRRSASPSARSSPALPAISA